MSLKGKLLNNLLKKFVYRSEDLRKIIHTF